MIIGIQLIAILFAFMMIYFALLNYRRGEIDRIEFLSWTIIWSLTIFIVIFPALLRDLAQHFFITRLFDLIIVGGFILVISMVSKAYLKTRKMEKKLEELVRKKALKDIKKKK